MKGRYIIKRERFDVITFIKDIISLIILQIFLNIFLILSFIDARDQYHLLLAQIVALNIVVFIFLLNTIENEYKKIVGEEVEIEKLK